MTRIFPLFLALSLTLPAAAQEPTPAPAADAQPKPAEAKAPDAKAAAEPATPAPVADAPAEPAAAKPDPCAEGGSGKADGLITGAQTSLGTELSLGIDGISCEAAAKASADVFALFERIEKLTDDKDADSPLRRINDGAGKEAIEVTPEFFALIQLAVGFAQHTDGAFDPTFAALAGMWTFHAGASQIPTETEIDQRRALVDYKQVILNEEARTVMLGKEGMRLGLGGIVKGYTMDKAVTLLKKAGVDNFILKSGGEIFVAGKPGGVHRRLGIPDPRSEKNYALLDVRDRALNTSSDNEKFFIESGVRYHHIINASTGRPARASRSVSVLSVDATSADALSTAIFVMGAKDGMSLVEQLAGVEAIIVDSDNQVHISSGLSSRLVLGAPTDRRP